MRVFRAIGFSNLHYSVTKPVRDRWAALAKEASPRNWWMLAAHKRDVGRVIGDVIHNMPGSVAQTSRAFSALQGGRFNAPKSHGALYCSQNPLIAALEVTYHTIVNALSDMRRIGKLERQYTNAVNLQLPKELNFLIAVFVLELRPSSIWEPDVDLSTLKGICDDLGYARYTSENFDRDFIFGNEYTLTQILGANALANRHDALRVGSARLAEQSRYKNVVLLDGDTDVRVRPEYYIYRVRAEPGEGRSPHRVEIQRTDIPQKSILLTLENVPGRPSRNSAHVKNYPASGADRLEKTREVVVQKFGPPEPDDM